MILKPYANTHLDANGFKDAFIKAQKENEALFSKGEGETDEAPAVEKETEEAA